MKYGIIALVTFFLSGSLVLANEAPLLSDKDYVDVLGASIALKVSCKPKDVSACRQADAVLKMLRYNLRVEGTAHGLKVEGSGHGLKVEGSSHGLMQEGSAHREYLQTYSDLFLDAFLEGMLDAKALNAKAASLVEP